MEPKQLVQVWSINLANGEKLRAAIIEQDPRQRAGHRYIRRGKCNRCGFCCLGGYKNDPCEYLVWDRENAVCRIYGDHPISCKLFPEAPPILTEKCGYHFIDTWTGRKLGARET